MDSSTEADTKPVEGAIKVNGEVNGSYEEPMEVDGDEDIISVKKIASDINCVSEVNNKDLQGESDKNEEIATSACEVPHQDEIVSSNGLNTNCEDNLVANSQKELRLNNEEEKEDKNKDSCQAVPSDPVANAGSLDHNNSNSELDCVKSETKSAMEVDVTDTTEDPPENSDESLIIDDKSKSENDNTCEEKDNNLVEKDSSIVDTTNETDNPIIINEDSTSEKSKLDDDLLDSTPDKGKKSKKVQQPINIVPRRSSRNLNKQKSYIEKEDELEVVRNIKRTNEDPDIEEIAPVDPLADPIQENNKFKTSSKKNTIVVNDTKRLVEIASGGKQSKINKKEPTLVIIDTNSILSGRGPIPISSSSSSSSGPGTSRGQGYSVLPVALPAQGMYPQMRSHSQMKSSLTIQPSQPAVPPPQAKPPIILPSLTDDMYVVEAPSFIVPYVYEKPPIKPLKDYVDQIEQAIKEIKEQLEKEKQEKKDAEIEKKDAEIVKKEDETEKAEPKAGEEENDTKNEVKADNKEDVEGNELKSKEEDDTCKDKNQDKSPDDNQTPKIEETKKENDATKTDEAKSDVAKKTEDSSEKNNDNKVEISSKENGNGSISVLESKVNEKSSVEEKEDSESAKTEDKSDVEKSKKSNSYFDNPLGKFFIQIGVNLVQEHVQTDLLRSQKRKKDRDGANCAPEVQMAITSLIRTLEFSKENNEPFRLEQKKCEFCSFKTESSLVMAHHLETPHMRNYVYRCNFCPLEVRSPHDILFHMEAEHNVRGRLERAPAFHQCPSCPFEDNQKGKLTRHLLSCAKKYRPERNQEPPLDFEPPAKIPRISRNRPSMAPGNAVYQAAMSGLKQGSANHPLLPKLVPAAAPSLGQTLLNRGRGRPQMLNRYIGGDMRSNSPLAAQQKAMAAAAQMRPGMLYRPSGSNAQPQVLLPTSYQLTGNQMYQNSSGKSSSSNNSGGAGAAAKLLQQPSISITPLPRQQASPSSSPTPSHGKPGRPLGSGKATFVICEICDGYIKDLEQLRNHMQWIHKVKIHPKMIYNRPPLNCQKCQFRFFTDQGLERHLLGSHGLVTSSMQEAANKGKDGGRCPVCGRVYQWKLLNHVARDHNMSLKPAHLSYKCTVCTATFGMYKQFENHVYSAHSVVAKRVMDKKNTSASQPSTSTSSQGDSLLKPLKINDEITIIPQPVRNTKPLSKPGTSTRNVPQPKGKV